MSTDFSARLAGFPHPDGAYTCEVTTDETGTWFMAVDGAGRFFEVQDQPEEVICLCGVVHVEQRVKDPVSGRVIFAVSDWPIYWQRHLAERKERGL